MHSGKSFDDSNAKDVFFEDVREQFKYLENQSPFFQIRKLNRVNDFGQYTFSFPPMENFQEKSYIGQQSFKVIKEENFGYNYELKEDVWKADLPLLCNESSPESERAEVGTAIALSDFQEVGKYDEDDEDSSESGNYEPIRRRGQGRPPENTGLGKRKDVVLKNLFRKIKTFIWKDLNLQTRYSIRKKNKRINFYQKCLTFYIKNILEDEATPRNLFMLGSLLYWKDMKTLMKANPNSVFGTKDQASKKIREVDQIHTNKFMFQIIFILKFIII